MLCRRFTPSAFDVFKSPFVSSLTPRLIMSGPLEKLWLLGKDCKGWESAVNIIPCLFSLFAFAL
jgi:hypothetical protein